MKTTRAKSLSQSDVPARRIARLEPQIRHIIDHMENAAAVQDSGVIVAINRGVPSLFGCPAEMILWRRLDKFINRESLTTLSRWIESEDQPAILVNALRASGHTFVLRLQTIASLLYSRDRRIKIISLIEFAAKERLAGTPNHRWGP